MRTSRLGVAVDERLILAVAFHAPDAEERIATLLERQRPTAIFAANNTLAEHAVARACGDSGGGCLGTSRSSASTMSRGWRWSSPGSPPCPSRHWRWAEGRRAAAARVHRPDGSRTVETLAATLIVRGSTAAPPARRSSRKPTFLLRVSPCGYVLAEDQLPGSSTSAWGPHGESVEEDCAARRVQQRCSSSWQRLRRGREARGRNGTTSARPARRSTSTAWVAATTSHRAVSTSPTR